MDQYGLYRKGPFAMYTLTQYVTEEQVNVGLARLIEKHKSGEPATPLDLYRELQAVTPDSVKTLLHDLFEANTFWELTTDNVTAHPAESGTWHVNLDLKARKVVVSPEGVETEIPMDGEWIEIGVFAHAEVGDGVGKPLYVKKHRIHSGEQSIKVTVPSKPRRAAIDPYHLMIDLDTDDNYKKVEIE
jgi:ABC-2 type transport system permease protein